MYKNHEPVIRPQKVITKNFQKTFEAPAKEYITQPIHFKEVINNREKIEV